MRGKHEIKKNKSNKKIKLLPAAIIIIGIIMFATASVIEASHYPWQRLFGAASQNEASIPDPTAIKLDKSDAANSTIVDTQASPRLGPPSVEIANLPGDEDDSASASDDNTFDVIGILKIPALNVSQNLLEGSNKQMKYGVGHVAGTSEPGQKGNCAISGHRPFPFRYLDQLIPGDNVIIKTGKITYTYKVYEQFNVLPDEVWVLNAIAGKDYTLTLITCTPYMVSSHRLIVRAELTDINGKPPAEYYGFAAPSATDTPVSEPSAAVTDNQASPEVSPQPSAEPTAAVGEPQETPSPQASAP
jgi:LPXTG-site transpeptidase (sortase) family protein